MKKTVRFWQYAVDGYVRLALRKDRPIMHERGGPTEEGFWYECQTWRFDGKFVWYTVATESRDCDGPISTRREFKCEVDALDAFIPNVDDGYPSPLWIEVDHYRRDLYAEMMNY